MQAGLVLLISLVFVTASGCLLLTGHDDSVAVWGGLSFFGGCAFVALCEILSGRRTTTFSSSSDDDDEIPERIVVHSRKLIFAMYFLGSAGLTSAAAIMIANGRAGFPAWLAAGFFGVGSIVLLRQVLDPRPRLVIDEFGVFDRTLGVGWIAWRDVIGMSVCSVHGNEFLCLELVDPSIYLARLSPWWRRLVVLNRVIGFAELNVNLAGLEVDTDELLELMSRYVRQAAEPREAFRK